ncbi:F0F1 ATP synthase subunit epsilon [Psychromarinibacter halotolerans]|uniref:ATP synthase epsilon chain n=1 Tax=Psychromarinibacter halotolerans TaxID=1775175 RepID=A0ABV7GR63_9RHOB|nr:F0F1 ATP synthase subunit epsilon [Psychromarinibacter halotolerans]MDF0597867.1 F0F1 ATP synthase subunit epsilon [Psychromarinibacter halotolerans]
MADTMQFDLVSPERKLASVQATAVRIPGTEGDLTAMPGHAPVITTLRPGVLSVEGPDGTQDYVVSGGFAEIAAESTSVLAERAIPRGEVTKDFLDELRAEAEARHEAAEDHEKDVTSKALSDLAHLAEDMV